MTEEVQNLSRRILLILPDEAAGGGHAMNLRLASQLKARGWIVDVAILFSRNRNPFYSKDFPKLRFVRLQANSKFSRVLLPLRLASLAKEYELVIAGLDLAATNYGFIASRIAKRPLISWTHTSFNEYSQTISRINRAISIWVYRHIRHIVFPSRGSQDSLTKALGSAPPSACWQVIENFHHHHRREEFAKVALPSHIFSRPVVISVGRLSKEKAYDRLVRIHATLLQRGVDHHLVVLGEGSERTRLNALAAQLGVSKTFFLPGHIQEPRFWLEASTVFALCSMYEGLPLVMIEALEAGTPIAAMDCPSGPREILEGGNSGLLVPAGDEIALANGIARLLSSSTLRMQFSNRGKQVAKAYAPELIIPRWEFLLNKIIEDNKNGRA